MDFLTALGCQVFRDELHALGVYGPSSFIRDFPFAGVNSFEDLASLLSRNMLLGDDGVAVSIAVGSLSSSSSNDAATSTSGATLTDQQRAIALQRYFQLHALTWPNAIVRVVRKEALSGAPSSAPLVSASSFRVGVVRSVSIAIPKMTASNDSASRSAALAHPAGPSDSLPAFVNDYLSKMIFLRVDFGDNVVEKLPFRSVSNEAFTADEFSGLHAAIAASYNTVFTNPATALEFFFRELPSTTHMRLYSCRLVNNANNKQATNGANTTLLPKRTYPQALQRSFASAEPLRSFGGLYLTRAVQQLFAFESAFSCAPSMSTAGAGLDQNTETDEANNRQQEAKEEEVGTLTYKELSVLLNNIIAPQLERLHEMIIEQSLSNGGLAGGAGGNSGSGLGGGMAQLEESRREVYAVQLQLKEAKERCARLRSDLDNAAKELTNEKTNLKNALLESAKLTKVVETWRTRALDNRLLLVETRAMLKMNENAGPEEVLQALRRKLPSQ